jgi:ribosomal protein L37AE/L43A
VKPKRADEPACADCGAQPVSMILSGISLCDRCYDARIAASTG